MERGATGRCSSGNGPPSDFGLYHAIAVKKGRQEKRNSDTWHSVTLDTPHFAAPPLSLCYLQVTWAAARYLEQTQIERLLAAREAFYKMDLLILLPIPNLGPKVLRLLVAKPGNPTSNGKQWAVHPWALMSDTNLWYFALLYSFLSSICYLPMELVIHQEWQFS